VISITTQWLRKLLTADCVLLLRFEFRIADDEYRFATGFHVETRLGMPSPAPWAATIDRRESDGWGEDTVHSETPNIVDTHPTTSKMRLLAVLLALRALDDFVGAFSVHRGDASKRYLSPSSLRQQSNNKLTEWVVENLENETSSVTSSSISKAGENDTLPENGLRIGNVRILTADSPYQPTRDDDLVPIRLLVGRNGWGTGVHPTTRLCLEWLSRSDVIQDGDTILDYGCGSGILSLAALHMGAARAIGVDVEAEALVTATRNLELNDLGERFEGLHTREVIPFGLCRPTGCDVCVANILIGQLVRPSMVSALVSNLRPGGFLCLSGIRPAEVDSLKAAYEQHVEWMDDHYRELSAEESEGSIESYGFDVGSWSRLVGRIKDDNNMDVNAMSELAVS
jgi:ribosomal protein L11 methylase PrmA